MYMRTHVSFYCLLTSCYCAFLRYRHFIFLFILTRTPPNPPLFPYTTLFRSGPPPDLQHAATHPGRGRHGPRRGGGEGGTDRKSTRLNSSHRCSSYAVFCLKIKNK